MRRLIALIGLVLASPVSAAAVALLALTGLSLPSLVSAAAPAVRQPGQDGPLTTEKLSNETTLTRWAHPVLVSPIRRSPSLSAGTVGLLRLFTEDRQFEVYLVLASKVGLDGHTWLQVRIPGRPNGRTGWALAEALGKIKLVRTRLVINRKAFRATLTRAGKTIWSSPIGIGKSATPTPPGHFYVRERLRNLGGDDLYGPWAFGTSAYSNISDWPRGGVVGIHGTNKPQLIPGRPSHGCVRVPNAKINQLARLMPIGTPILVI
jgi:hypothetical protein